MILKAKNKKIMKYNTTAQVIACIDGDTPNPIISNLFADFSGELMQRTPGNNKSQAEKRLQAKTGSTTARQANSKPSPKQASKAHAVTPDIEIIQYSDRAIAVIGNTYPIKGQLMEIGGKFNAHLKHQGQQVTGYIFSKKHELKIKTTFEI